MIPSLHSPSFATYREVKPYAYAALEGFSLGIAVRSFFEENYLTSSIASSIFIATAYHHISSLAAIAKEKKDNKALVARYLIGELECKDF